MDYVLDGLTNVLIMFAFTIVSMAIYIISLVLYCKNSKNKDIGKKRAVFTLTLYAIVHLSTVSLLWFYPETASGYGYLNRAWIAFSLLLLASAIGFFLNIEDKELKKYIPGSIMIFLQIVINMGWAMVLTFTTSPSYSAKYYYNLDMIQIWKLNGEIINLTVIALNVILLPIGFIIHHFRLRSNK